MILVLAVQGKNLSPVTELNTFISGREYNSCPFKTTEAGIADEF